MIGDLVSVIVVSYNSANTIVETLDSVRGQKYENIELVVADDCSKDDTVSVARRWLEDNGYIFKGGFKLLTSNENKGVCSNLNRAILNSKGIWIKIIAADDILFPNCCFDYISYVTNHTDSHFVTSYLSQYLNTFEDKNCIRRQYATSDSSIFEKSPELQLREMAYKIFVMAPTMFFSRSLFDRVAGFDENFIYEDHPFYLKILEHNYKVCFMSSTTVGYRIHDSSFNSNKKLFNYLFSRESKRFRYLKCWKYYNTRRKIAVKAYYRMLDILEYLHLNKNTKITSLIFRYVCSAIWKLGK